MAVKFTSRTPWREKLGRVQEPKVVKIPPAMQRGFGTGTICPKVEAFERVLIRL